MHSAGTQSVCNSLMFFVLIHRVEMDLSTFYGNGRRLSSRQRKPTTQEYFVYPVRKCRNKGEMFCYVDSVYAVGIPVV